MGNRIEEAFRTDNKVATGDKPTVAEPPPVQKAPKDTVTNVPVDAGAAVLFGSDEAVRLRARWQDIQIAFVDEPRKSVQQADELVEAVAKRLVEMFADQRHRLEQEWDKGQISTEELRNAFRRYRTLFDRLLSM
jgi:hypothetical protein